MSDNPINQPPDPEGLEVEEAEEEEAEETYLTEAQWTTERQNLLDQISQLNQRVSELSHPTPQPEPPQNPEPEPPPAPPSSPEPEPPPAPKSKKQLRQERVRHLSLRRL